MADVKQFANWELLPDDVSSHTHTQNSAAHRPPLGPLTRAFSPCPTQRQHRREQQKVSSDFQKALHAFQAASRRSAERQRTFVERAKTQLDPALEPPA